MNLSKLLILIILVFGALATLIVVFNISADNLKDSETYIGVSAIGERCIFPRIDTFPIPVDIASSFFSTEYDGEGAIIIFSWDSLGAPVYPINIIDTSYTGIFIIQETI